MTDDIISLDQARQERSPHLAGQARCVDCGHRWAAVAPCGTMVLECPECHGMKGLWTYSFGPDAGTMVYTCVVCESTHLTAYKSKREPDKTRFMCVGCGSAQSIESLFD